MELKKANHLCRLISFPTFIAHIKRMLSQLELNRKDTGERGKKSVSYSLTECARKKRKLRIFRPTPIQSAAMQVYTKIFLFSVIDKKTFKVQDLDAFLSELGVPREKLVPDTIRYLEK